jgi:hypothetical protein
MRTVLAATVALAIVSSGSAAPLPSRYYRDDIPPQYRGIWCIKTEGTTDILKRCRAATRMGDLIITANRIEMIENVCEQSKIIVPKPKNITHISVKLFCANDPEKRIKDGDVTSTENNWRLGLELRLRDNDQTLLVDDLETD